MNRYVVQPSLQVSYVLRICLLAIAIICLLVLVAHVSAQDGNQWPAPRRIPGYAADSTSPILIADQNRTVHALNSTWIEDEKVLVYSQWTKSTGWTIPIDIILPQLKTQTRVKGAHLDQDGLGHLIFFSGDQQQAGIFYSSAPLDEADHAPAWSVPILIGQFAEDFPEEAALVSDSKGDLFVLYSAREPSAGLYAVHSSDGGNSWSDPVSVFQTYRDKSNSLKMYVDSQDNVHAVWGEVNEAGHGQGVYYSRKEAGSTDWSESVALSTESTGVKNTPAIVEYRDELLAIFHGNGASGLTRFMVRSSDGGQTWLEKVRLFEQVGSNGPTSFVVDSNDILHAFFGNRITTVGGGIIHGMWHSIWEGNGWSNPEAIVSGPRVIDEEGGKGFDPSFANAIVSQGNTLLVSWQTDPGAGLNGNWYTYTTTMAPELAAVPLPTQVPITPSEVADSSDSNVVNIVASPTPFLTNETNLNVLPISTGDNPINSVVVALIPVIILVLIVPIAYRLFRLSRMA